MGRHAVNSFTIKFFFVVIVVGLHGAATDAKADNYIQVKTKALVEAIAFIPYASCDFQSPELNGSSKHEDENKIDCVEDYRKTSKADE
ncbi:hypothetical protein Trydic_g1835 [Trypoxylus dichotomus]